MYFLSRIRSLSLLIWKQINMVKFSNLLSVGAFPGGSLGFCILQKYITVQLVIYSSVRKLMWTSFPFFIGADLFQERLPFIPEGVVARKKRMEVDTPKRKLVSAISKSGNEQLDFKFVVLVHSFLN